MYLMTRFSKISMVVVSSAVLVSTFVPMNVSAASLSEDNQTIEIAATPKITSIDFETEAKTTEYKVGQEFKASEISFRVFYNNGTSKVINHGDLKFTVDNQTISNGYKWKVASKKHVIVTYKDYTGDFYVNVTAADSKPVSNYELVTTKERLNYKVGDPFQADDLFFRFHYTDGTQKDFDHTELYIHTSDGQTLGNNYKFTVPGDKTIVVECHGYIMSYNIHVSSAQAANTGWSNSPDGTWQYYRNGSLVRGWLQDGGIWYFLDNDGDMRSGGWLQSDGGWYYLNQSGAMLANGWVQDSGKWYYLDNDGNMLANGWVEYNGATYYLNADGSMAVNTIIDGYAVGSDGKRQ